MNGDKPVKTACRNQCFQTLVENTPDPIVVHRDGRLIYVNPAAVRMIGAASAQDLLGKSILSLIHRDFHEIVLQRTKLALSTGESAPLIELKYVKLDGTSIDAEVQAALIEYEGEKAIQVAIRDISERKRVEHALRLSEDIFKKAFEYSPDSMNINRVQDGMYVSINRHFTKIMGYTPSEIVGHTSAEFKIWKDPADRLRLVDGLKKHGFVTDLEAYFVAKDGSVRCGLMSAIVVDIEDAPHVLNITRDITERKQVELELRIAAVAFGSENGMLIADASGVILRVNSAFTRLTGYGADEAIGQTPKMLSSGRQDYSFYQKMWATLTAQGHWQGEIWNKRKDGRIFAEMLSITAIETPGRGVTHYVGSFTDITEGKESEAKIHRLAYYDHLTRLPNRRLLQDRLGQALAAAGRSQQYGAMFFIDLDNFKTLNDTLGHDMGDLLLVEVAKRLRSEVRESDTVARQGGDEFVVLMEALGSDANDAVTLARHLGEKLRKAIDTPFDLGVHAYHCRVSIGVGLFTGEDTVEELFKHADLALYQAKSHGRNTLRFFDPAMQSTRDKRSTLEGALRKALELDQLMLHYQPQVDFLRRVTGVEALLRWQHPVHGLVPPDAFIPLAEDTGLILSIGRWVLETACEQLKDWEGAEQTCELIMAVNVSPSQFRQPEFVSQVHDVLSTSGVNPALLKLELTESLVLENMQDSMEKMKAIKCLGVTLAMDDFGTGYSSLANLAQLPLDQIKIDRSFVRNIPGKRSDEAIARIIISMSQGLTMQVIAEGVETEAQWAFLETNGCLAFQGDLLSRPVPAAEFEAWLERIQ